MIVVLSAGMEPIRIIDMISDAGHNHYVLYNSNCRPMYVYICINFHDKIIVCAGSVDLKGGKKINFKKN